MKIPKKKTHSDKYLSHVPSQLDNLISPMDSARCLDLEGSGILGILKSKLCRELGSEVI